MRLTAENTALVVDSTADFPEARERFDNWRIVPLYVRFGDESLRDYEDLKPPEFYARLRTSEELPTTSQPTPGDFLATYSELERYERIVSLHISAKLSGTYESARLAASDVGNKVRVIDSKTASAAIALLGLAIQRRLDRGTTDEEIDALVDRYHRDGGLLFTVDTLEFLRRGGRIGNASAMAGQLLKVKPILSLQEGEVLPVKRVRGNQKAFAEFVTTFRERTSDGPGLRVGIAHADAPDRAEALVEMVERERPNAQVELATTLGAVIGTHAGPGTVGFFWFEDDL
ncbi:MAG TPA: DegV family protein [Gaiellaceae bacterium]|nr:DegV family protein [Gaiellaceae bacterium]